MRFWIHMTVAWYNPMNNFFKIIGLALAVHFIVKTVQKELKQ